MQNTASFKKETINDYMINNNLEDNNFIVDYASNHSSKNNLELATS